MIDQSLKTLAKYLATNKIPEKYSASKEDMQRAFCGELKKICGSIPSFLKNRYDLYEILTENADEVVPVNVSEALGMLADIRVVDQGQKVVFKNSNVNSKMRAKKFLTQVGLAGVYESFRLDTSTFEVGAHAVGGAVTIDWERLLDNAELFSDVMEIMTQGLIDSVFVEVQKALKAAVSANAPEANRVISSSFDADKMFALCNTVKTYAGPQGNAIIFAPPEFIANMGPDAIVPVTAQGAQGIYHPQDIDMIHNTGYINIFRGFPVIPIPQSYVDTNNKETWVDPQLAYVLPSGTDDRKIIKVVLEGKTQMYDWQNKDNSMEMQIYRKIGVAILNYYNFGIYQNTGITQTYYNPYPYI